LNRAVIYARVSTDSQDARQTIQQQLVDCERYCQQQGWTVVERYTDDGVSGASEFNERPAGARLLTAVELKPPAFDHLVIAYLDRLSRSNEVGVPLYNRLVRLLNGQVHFVHNSFDDTIEGQMQFGIFMSIAEYERGQIRRRTMKGVTQRVKAGEMYRASTPPYGYKYNRETKQLEVRADTAAVVKRIYTLFLSGKGPLAIATELDKASVPPPCAGTSRKNELGWHKSAVRRILTSPVYIGQGRYRSRDPSRPHVKEFISETPMECPPLVDEATFERVQHLVKTRAVDGPRLKHFYLLQGLLWCSVCGRRYGPWSGHGRWYKCVRRAQQGERAGHRGVKWAWKADVLERVVKEFTRQVMRRPTILLPHVEAHLGSRQREFEQQLNAAKPLLERAEQLEREEERVLDGWQKGLYKDEAQVQKRLDSVRSERGKLDADLKRLQKQAAQTQDTVAALEELRREALELVGISQSLGHPDVEFEEPKTEEDWKRLISYLVDRVHVGGVGKKLSLRFEGVLIHPSLDEAHDLPVHVVTAFSRPR